MTTLAAGDSNADLMDSASEVRVGYRPGHALISIEAPRVAGEVCAELETRLMELLREGQTRVVVEPCGGAAMSLDALRALGRLSRRFADMGGALVVVGLDKPARKALRAVDPDAPVAMASNARAGAKAVRGRGFRHGARGGPKPATA